MSNDRKSENDKEKEVTNISRILKLSKSQLKECEHDSDITKTCRNIIKIMFPDNTIRARKRISSMSSNKIHAIHCEC